MPAQIELVTDNEGFRIGLKNDSTLTTAAASISQATILLSTTVKGPTQVDASADPSANIIWMKTRGNLAKIRFLMKGADNCTCRFLVMLGDPSHVLVGDTGGGDVLKPEPLVTVDATASTLVGIASGRWSATHRWADTLAIKGIVGTTGTVDPARVKSDYLYSPENNVAPAVLRIDHEGARWLGIAGDLNGEGGGTYATHWNAEVKFY